ncbi:MAG: M1 family metallopeptidase [Candidatus Micrarchaeales archaeon]|nr:M1 family metallopeptidase [Candidatus Micrarchaeales archaeon]
MAVKAVKHQTLGDIVRPSNYNLVIEPDMDNFTYVAHERISVKARKRTKIIKLNSKGLAIKSVVVKKGKMEQQGDFSLDEKNEELTIRVKEAVMGDAEVVIEFSGTCGDKLEGFYRSKYTANGKDHYILTSQFEAPSARAAFPCFDEPEFKATYDLTLVIDKGLDAISNMPVKSEKKFDAKRKQVTFQKTPLMSSYLLYLGVGKYDYLEDNNGRVKLRVVTTPGKKKYAQMALQFARKILDAEEQYFGIKFPLPKLDLIAIPDFSAGAMENWGAITFRETYLLGDEKLTAVVVKMHIIEVIAHEMVHQWFGDLVTMKWWDDIWLNESFATFMASRISDEVFPEYKMMVNYYRDTVATALSDDALKSTHPINLVVNTPGEISSAFDHVSYDKGGSVLFMLEDYVGREIFRKGLQKYLKKNAYNNATKFDLWNSIQDAAKEQGLDLPVSEVMSDWVDQPGYPIISLSENKEEGGYLVEQKRFTLLDFDTPEEWRIPVHYKSEMNEKRILLDDKRFTIKDGSQWIKLNYGQCGLYRVRYEQEMLDRIGRLIMEKRLGDIDAWGVDNDLFALARSGRIPAKRYVDFVKSYMMDCAYPANVSVSGHLSFIYMMTEGLPYHESARLACIEFNKGILSKLGWEKKENESMLDIRTRAMAISSLGFADDRETVEKANAMFNAFVAGKGEIDTNLKAAIYGIVARSSGSNELFDRFLKMYKEQPLPEEKIKALQSIGLMTNPELMVRALETSLMQDKVRLQDSIILINSVGSNIKARAILLQWMKKNWKRLMSTYESAGRMLVYALDDLEVYADRQSRKEIDTFFRKKENMRDDIKRELEQVLEKIDANVQFVEANRD